MAAKVIYRRLRKTLIVLLLLFVGLIIYIEVVNRNSKDMNYRQKVLKAVYPALMWWTKITGKNTRKMDNQRENQPVASFYELSVKGNNGAEMNFSDFKGKKVLLVNTASDCGYTNQYEDLQKLYEGYKDKLVVIGFPANDFKEQEKGTDQEIAAFCKANFGITFPLAQKSVVVKGAGQNPVFQWLTDSSKNGWCNQPPTWNFSKYLVNEKGTLTGYFGPSVSPGSEEVIRALGRQE